MDITLQTTLATVIQQFADFFGTTTEMIIQNAPYWLAKYGWYSAFGKLGLCFFGGTCFAFGIFLTIVLICYFGESDKFPVKTTIVLCLISFILPSILTTVHCAIAPEIYGLEALFALIK